MPSQLAIHATTVVGRWEPLATKVVLTLSVAVVGATELMLGGELEESAAAGCSVAGVSVVVWSGVQQGPLSGRIDSATCSEPPDSDVFM